MSGYRRFKGIPWVRPGESHKYTEHKRQYEKTQAGRPGNIFHDLLRRGRVRDRRSDNRTARRDTQFAVDFDSPVPRPRGRRLRIQFPSGHPEGTRVRREGKYGRRRIINN